MTLTVNFNLRVPPELIARIDKLVPTMDADSKVSTMVGGVVTRSDVARLALLRGLDDLELEYATASPNPPAPADSPGAMLRRWRRDQGLTQHQAAEKLGLGQRAWSAMERQEYRPNPGVQIAVTNLTGLPRKMWTTEDDQAQE